MTSSQRRLGALIGLALVAQLCTHYFSNAWTPIPYFRGVHMILRWGVPLLSLLTWLGYSWKSMGVAWPTISRKLALRIGVLLAIATVIVLAVCHSDAYRSWYAESFASERVPRDVRIRGFAVFTLTTVPGWEIIHRSFLLFGIANILEKEERVSRNLAWAVAIFVTAVFESMFHMIKPPAEAFGLALASPILSWLALSTGSFLLPLVIHLWIEGLFIAAMTGLLLFSA